MKVTLSRIRAEDGRALDVMVHRPLAMDHHAQAPLPTTAVVHIHGKGGNFYSGTSRFLPENGTGGDILHLSLNMRCHDLGYSRADVPYSDLEDGGRYIHVDGGFWEDLAVGHLDLRAAVAHAHDLGAKRVVLSGHSSGGYYVADYCSRYDDVDGRILLSPVLSNLRSVRAWFPTAARLAEARALAQTYVDRDQDWQLIPVDTWYHAVSARSFLQRLDEAEDPLLRRLLDRTLPTLVLWGGAETRAGAWRVLVDSLPSPTTAHHEVPGADHNYLGHDDQVTRVVGDFLAALDQPIVKSMEGMT